MVDLEFEIDGGGLDAPGGWDGAGLFAVDVEEHGGGAGVGGADGDLAGAAALDFAHVEVFALINFDDEFGGFTFGEIVEENNLEGTVVEFSAGGDPHAGAEEFAVGDDEVHHFVAEFVGLIEADLDVDVFPGCDCAHGSCEEAGVSAEAFPGAVGVVIDFSG